MELDAIKAIGYAVDEVTAKTPTEKLLKIQSYLLVKLCTRLMSLDHGIFAQLESIEGEMRNLGVRQSKFQEWIEGLMNDMQAAWKASRKP